MDKLITGCRSVRTDDILGRHVAWTTVEDPRTIWLEITAERADAGAMYLGIRRREAMTILLFEFAEAARGGRDQAVKLPPLCPNVGILAFPSPCQRPTL